MSVQYSKPTSSAARPSTTPSPSPRYPARRSSSSDTLTMFTPSLTVNLEDPTSAREGPASICVCRGVEGADTPMSHLTLPSSTSPAASSSTSSTSDSPAEESSSSSSLATGAPGENARCFPLNPTCCGSTKYRCLEGGDFSTLLRLELELAGLLGSWKSPVLLRGARFCGVLTGGRAG